MTMHDQEQWFRRRWIIMRLNQVRLTCERFLVLRHDQRFSKVLLSVDSRDEEPQAAWEYGWGVSSRDGSRWKSLGVI